MDLFIGKCWIASHPQNMCVVRREGFWVLDDFPSVVFFWVKKITLNPVLFTGRLIYQAKGEPSMYENPALKFRNNSMIL